jgi:hypothetical protein
MTYLRLPAPSARQHPGPAPVALAEFAIAGGMQQCVGPGTPNVAPKQSIVVLTCYFASVINLGAAFLTHAIESLNAWFPGRRRMLRARVPAAPGEPVGEIHGVAGAEDGRHEAGRLGRVCARADRWRG